jgi:hypothetical protein
MAAAIKPAPESEKKDGGNPIFFLKKKVGGNRIFFQKKIRWGQSHFFPKKKGGDNRMRAGEAGVGDARANFAVQ